MRDPLGIFETLLSYYLRYYETPFSVRDEGISGERHELLVADGEIYREPWLEVLPKYATVGHSIGRSCELASAPPELADFAVPGLLPEGVELYRHQEDALQSVPVRAARCTHRGYWGGEDGGIHAPGAGIAD